MASPKIRPLFARVLIRKQAPANKIGNIELPDTAQKKYPIGEVLAIGDGKDDKPMKVKVGQKVLFNDYGHAPIPEEKDLVIIDQDNILAMYE